MKALVIALGGVLRLEDRPTPRPTGDEILVRVVAAGVNRADVMQREGHYPAPPGSPPDIPGLEFSGIIESVGGEVGTLSAGQRVFGLVGGGAQAEYVLTREALAVRVPDAVPDEEAGGIPEAFITAHDALVTQGRARTGDRVLVHAAGSGVGLAALQLAKSVGCSVFGTSRSAGKLEKAKPFGLDFGIDSTREAFDEVIARHTHGAGVDIIIDFVGAPFFDRNIATLAPLGRLVVVSTLGGAKAELSLRALMTKRLRVMGTMLRSRSFEQKVDATRAFARDVVPLLAARSVRMPIDRTFRLTDAAAAHDYVESNQNFGKVVFTL